MPRFGLSALLEATRCKAKEETEFDEAADMIIGESVTDEDVKNEFIGDGSVESEMRGDSLTDDEVEKLSKILKLIPEDTEDEEANLDQLDDIMESYIIKELNGGMVY